MPIIYQTNHIQFITMQLYVMFRFSYTTIPLTSYTHLIVSVLVQGRTVVNQMAVDLSKNLSKLSRPDSSSDVLRPCDCSHVYLEYRQQHH